MRINYLWSFLIVAVCMYFAMSIGAYSIPFVNILPTLWNQTEGYEILFHIRMPRVLMSVIVGAALGIAGATSQGLFRNPLADPGLIGISSGASVGAAVWIVLLSNSAVFQWGLPFAAFLGGTLAVLCVWMMAGGIGSISTSTLLLAGIAMNSIAGTIIGIFVYLSDEQELQSLTFWMLGSLGRAHWDSLITILPPFAVGSIIMLSITKSLNLLSLGEIEAGHLGVRVQKLKLLAILGISLSVGAAVALCGAIGFIGLVVPHIVRMFGGVDHRYVLPMSMLYGACILILSDMGSRVIVSPAELPVGILTSLIGAPFFLGLLYKHRSRLTYA